MLGRMFTAGRLVVATIVGVLVADGWLIHKDRESVSRFCNRHFFTYCAACVVLAMHFRSWPKFLRRIDPFAAASRLLRP